MNFFFGLGGLQNFIEFCWGHAQKIQGGGFVRGGMRWTSMLKVVGTCYLSTGNVLKALKASSKSPTITTVTETIAQALFDLTAFAHNAFVPRTIVLCISTQY